MEILGGRASAARAERVVGAVFTDAECERLTALWQPTALSCEEFDADYGEMLLWFWRCVATPAGADWTTLRDQALICAVVALRIEMGRFQKSTEARLRWDCRIVIRCPDEMRGRGDVTDMGLLGGQSVPIWAATEGK